MRRYKIILACLLLSCSIGAKAQVLYKSVLSCGGSSYSSTGLYADWTVDQPVINQYTTTGLTVTEGFHPIFIEAAPTGVNNIKGNIHSVKAYPNPTTNVVNIAIEQSQPKAVSIDVLDISGKAVMNSMNLPAQTNINTTVNLSQLSTGTYIIMINANASDAYKMKVVKE